MKKGLHRLAKIIKEEISNIVQENMPALLQQVKDNLGPERQADEKSKQLFRKKYARKANIYTGRKKDDPWGMDWVIGVEKIG